MTPEVAEKVAALVKDQQAEHEIVEDTAEADIAQEEAIKKKLEKKETEEAIVAEDERNEKAKDEAVARREEVIADEGNEVLEDAMDGEEEY